MTYLVIRTVRDGEVLPCDMGGCLNIAKIVHDFKKYKRGFCKVHYLGYLQFKKELLEECNKDDKV